MIISMRDDDRVQSPYIESEYRRIVYAASLSYVARNIHVTESASLTNAHGGDGRPSEGRYRQAKEGGERDRIRGCEQIVDRLPK